MLQVVACNLKHSNNNNNNNNNNSSSNNATRYPWISRSLEANAHVPHHIAHPYDEVPHHIATLINHGVSMKLHFATTHWIALLRTSFVLICKILDSQGISNKFLNPRVQKISYIQQIGNLEQLCVTCQKSCMCWSPVRSKAKERRDSL